MENKEIRVFFPSFTDIVSGSLHIPLPFFHNKTLTEKFGTTKYMYNFSPIIRLLMIGGSKRYFFIEMKACSYSDFQLYDFAPYRVLKNDRSWSVNHVMNYPKATDRLVSYWTCFLLTDIKSNIVLICTRLTSIPSRITMNPKNFLTFISNTHLRGFTFIPYFRNSLKASSKYYKWSSRAILLIAISLI